MKRGVSKIFSKIKPNSLKFFFPLVAAQVKKTLDATMQTLQDMLTVEDFDVSEAFQHSQSTESVKSASSDSYMSKANVSKRRANQQETEGFYFTVSSTPARPNEEIRKNKKAFRQREPALYIIRNCSLFLFLFGCFFFYSFFCISAHLQKYKEYLNGSNLIVKLQAKHDLLKQTLGEGTTR